MGKDIKVRFRMPLLGLLLIILLSEFAFGTIYFGTYNHYLFDTTGVGSSEPRGITQNGTYFWITDLSDDGIYQYWMNGTYTNNNISLFELNTSGNNDSEGITQNGTYFWITDVSDAEVYEYWFNGTYRNVSFDTAASGSDNPRGITQNGTYFWITDTTDDEVYRFWLNGTYTSVSFDTAASGSDNPAGITQNGTYFWITDFSDDGIYQFWLNGTYTNTFISILKSGNGDSRGITQNGTYFWIVDDSDTQIYQYNMFSSETFYIRTDNDGNTSSANPQTVNFTALPNKGYAVLFNSLTDDDVVYSSGEYFALSESGYQVQLGDDNGSNEVTNFSYGAIPYGFYQIPSGQYIQCNTNIVNTGTATNETLQWSMLNGNYSIIASTVQDTDVPRFAEISNGSFLKNGTQFSYHIDDDEGAAEPVQSIDYCLFQYGEYSLNNSNFLIKAGNTSQQSGVVTVNFSSAFPNTNYVIFLTHNNGDGDDAGACETTTISAGSFTATCSDDNDTTTTVDGDTIDWVAITKGDFDFEAFPKWSNNYTNGTGGGKSINHSVNWSSDMSNLSGFIFSFDNGNGSFLNDTWVSMTGTRNQSNTTKVGNSTINSTIQWKVYANDSFNNLNVTSTFSYNITSTPTSIRPTLPASNFTNISGAYILNATILEAGVTANTTGYVIFYYKPWSYAGNETWIQIANTTNVTANQPYFNATWDTTTISDGKNYTLNFTAYNYGLGTVNSTNVSANMTIDNSGPIIAVYAANGTSAFINATVKSNATLTGSVFPGNLTLNISVTDDTVGLLNTSNAFCFVTVNNGLNHSVPLLAGRWCNSSDINITGLSDGNYMTIDIYVNDTLNNMRLNNSLIVQIDTTAPSAAATCSDAETGDAFPCSCSGTDTTSGVSSSSGSSDSPDGTNTPTTTGSFVYTCLVTDNAGHTATDGAAYRITSAGGGGAGSGGGSSSTSTTTDINKPQVYQFSKITPNETSVIQYTDHILAIRQIEINVNSEVQNVKVTVIKYNENPVIVEKEGKVYQYMQINVSNVKDKLSKATITAKVEKSWTTLNNVDKDSIIISKFNETSNEWKELQTIFESEDPTYYYYDAEVTNFSFFSVSGKTIEPEAQDEETESVEVDEKRSLPWLWILIGLVAGALIITIVLSVALIIKKSNAQQQVSPVNMF